MCTINLCLEVVKQETLRYIALHNHTERCGVCMAARSCGGYAATILALLTFAFL